MLIPLNIVPSEFVIITFHSSKMNATETYDEFVEGIVGFLSKIIDTFQKDREDTHAFTEPILSYNPTTKLFTVKIALMTKTELEGNEKKRRLP